MDQFSQGVLYLTEFIMRCDGNILCKCFLFCDMVDGLFKCVDAPVDIPDHKKCQERGKQYDKNAHIDRLH